MLLSWGPPRMGTTWLYNVLRAMAKTAHVELGVVADGVPLPAAGWRGPIIIKSHRADAPDLIARFDPSLQLHPMVMMRDPEPTLASLMRTQTVDLDELIGWLEADVASYEAVLPLMRNAVVIREEWVATRAADIISSIAELLVLELDDEQIESLAAEFARENVRRRVKQLEQSHAWQGDFSHYDRQTQWHAGHIGPDGPRRVVLDEAQAARVDAIRASIDSLTQRFTLWSRSTPVRTGASEVLPMAYVEARQRVINPGARSAFGFRGLLARLLSRSIQRG